MCYVDTVSPLWLPPYDIVILRMTCQIGVACICELCIWAMFNMTETVHGFHQSLQVISKILFFVTWDVMRSQGLAMTDPYTVPVFDLVCMPGYDVQQTMIATFQTWVCSLFMIISPCYSVLLYHLQLKEHCYITSWNDDSVSLLSMCCSWYSTMKYALQRMLWRSLMRIWAWWKRLRVTSRLYAPSPSFRSTSCAN